MLDRETQEKLRTLKSKLVEQDNEAEAKRQKQIDDFLKKQYSHPSELHAGRPILYRNSRVFFLEQDGDWGVPIYSIRKLFPASFDQLPPKRREEIYNLLLVSKSNPAGYHSFTMGSLRRLQKIVPDASSLIDWVIRQIGDLQRGNLSSVQAGPGTQLTRESEAPVKLPAKAAIHGHAEADYQPKRETSRPQPRKQKEPVPPAKFAPKQPREVVKSIAPTTPSIGRSWNIYDHMAFRDFQRASGRLRSAFRAFINSEPWKRPELSFWLKISTFRETVSTYQLRVELMDDIVELDLREFGHIASLDYLDENALCNFIDQYPARVVYIMAAALECATAVAEHLHEIPMLGHYRVKLTGEALFGHATNISGEGILLKPEAGKSQEATGALSLQRSDRSSGQPVNPDLYAFFIEAWKRHCADHDWLQLPPRFWVPIKAKDVFGIEQLFVELSEEYIAVEYLDTNSDHTHFLVLRLGDASQLIGNSNQMVVALTCALLAITDLLSTEVRERVVVTPKPRSYVRMNSGRQMPSRKVVFAPQQKIIAKRTLTGRSSQAIQSASKLGKVAIHVVADHIRRRPMTEAHYSHLKELEAQGRRFKNRLGQTLAIPEDRSYTIVTSHHRGNLDTEIVSKRVLDYVDFYKRLVTGDSHPGA